MLIKLHKEQCRTEFIINKIACFLITCEEIRAINISIRLSNGKIIFDSLFNPTPVKIQRLIYQKLGINVEVFNNNNNKWVNHGLT